MSKQTPLCRWNCGRETQNVSRICTDCWKASEQARSMSNEGHKAWLDAQHSKPSQLPNPKKQAAGRKAHAARMVKLELHLPLTKLSDGNGSNRLGNP